MVRWLQCRTFALELVDSGFHHRIYLNYVKSKMYNNDSSYAKFIYSRKMTREDNTYSYLNMHKIDQRYKKTKGNHQYHGAQSNSLTGIINIKYLDMRGADLSDETAETNVLCHDGPWCNRESL